MRYLMCLIVALFCGSLYADIIKTDGLTEDQIFVLKSVVKDMKTSAKAGPLSKESVKDYAAIGESIAKSIGAAASELGYAVDDFSKTFVGKVAVTVIVWKLLGRDIVKILVASFLLSFGVGIWSRYYTKMCIVESVTTAEDKSTTVKYYGPGRVTEARIMMGVVLSAIVGGAVAIICVGL